MIIDYTCNRCNKVVKARVYQVRFEKRSLDKRYHNRVDCTECGRYIKFVGDRELSDINPNWKNEIEIKSYLVEDDSVKPLKKKKSVRLAEMDFKLDLIMDHLGIK